MGKAKKLEKVMAIDSNYLMMRSNWSFDSLKTEDGRPSGILYGYISAFTEYLSEYNPDYYIPLFDFRHSTYRASVNPAYKANRKPKSKEMVAQMNACREFVRLAGWTPYREKGVEADDLAAKISYTLRGRYLVQLVSVDHDWRQLTADNVYVVRPRNGGLSDEVISYEKATDELGLPAERWAEIAAIMGDPGDNVIGVNGYGPARSKKMILKYGDLWTACAKDEKLRKHAKQVTDNYLMTKLDGTIPKRPIPLEQNKVSDVRNKVYDNDEILDFLESWDMKEIKEKVENHGLW